MTTDQGALAVPSPRPERVAFLWSRPAGLWMGGAMGALWLVVVFVPLLVIPRVPAWFEPYGAAVSMALTLGAWCAGGAGFAWEASRHLGRGSRRVLLAGGAASLATTLAGLAAAVFVENAAVAEGRVGRGMRPFAAAFAAVALALSLLPEWRVGGGGRAMVKGALVANLAAGHVGGATALRWLLPAPPPGR